MMLPAFSSLGIFRNLEKVHESLTAAPAQLTAHYHLALSVFPKDQYN